MTEVFAFTPVVDRVHPGNSARRQLEHFISNKTEFARSHTGVVFVVPDPTDSRTLLIGLTTQPK